MVYGGFGAFVIVIYLVSQIILLLLCSFLLCLPQILDTQLMMIGKHKHSFNPEDYVFAALSIFLDIISLFLYILMMVGATND